MKKFLITLLALAILLPSFAFGACTAAFTDTARQNFLDGDYEVSDTYKLAFYYDAATYNTDTTAYSATNEVSGTGYTAGGFIVADNGSTRPAPTTSILTDTAVMDFTDYTPTPVTFDTNPSTCAILYNDTEAGDPTVAVFTFSGVQPSAGDLVIDFPASGASTSTLQFAWNIIQDLFTIAEAHAADGPIMLEPVVETEEIHRQDGTVDAVVRIVGVRAVGAAQ